MDPLRIGVFCVAGSKWTVAIGIHVEHRVLGVVYEELKSSIAIAIADAKPNVDPNISDEVGDRSVKIPAVQDDRHIVDQILGIQQHRVSKIARAIKIQP